MLFILSLRQKKYSIPLFAKFNLTYSYFCNFLNIFYDMFIFQKILDPYIINYNKLLYFYLVSLYVKYKAA